MAFGSPPLGRVHASALLNNAPLKSLPARGKDQLRSTAQAPPTAWIRSHSRLGLTTGLSRQSDAVERPPAAAAQGAGSRARNWIHVADHARVLVPRAGESAQSRAFREARRDLHAPGRKPDQTEGGGRSHAQRGDEAQAGRTFVWRGLGGRLVAPPLVGVVAACTAST